jgi:hypothetical protein
MGRMRRHGDGIQAILATEHIVGRLPTSHLAIEASFVSAAHALIRWNGQFWEVRDLGSTNGTYVQGGRIAVGEAVRLKAGSEVVFGEPTETWRLIDDRGPTAVAIPLDGGEPSFLTSGTIAIPTPNEPLATIFGEGGSDRWLLEIDDAKTPIQPGQQFVVAGRAWRFECPSDAVSTRASGPLPRRLEEVSLVFEISSDEEHVSLRVEVQQAIQQLGQRASFYLALVLLRQRLAESRAGLAEPGWVEVDTILKMIPDYTSYSHLNVEIYRLRRLLFDAGIEDAARVIERRRGQIRFGTERAEILAAGRRSGASA